MATYGEEGEGRGLIISWWVGEWRDGGEAEWFLTTASLDSQGVN